MEGIGLLVDHGALLFAGGVYLLAIFDTKAET